MKSPALVFTPSSQKEWLAVCHGVETLWVGMGGWELASLHLSVLQLPLSSPGL